MEKKYKDKAIAALPYVAVAGVAIASIYALTKIVKSVNDAGDFMLDFGNDAGLSSMFNRK